MNNASELVDQAYFWILGRAADDVGRAFYAGALERGETDTSALRSYFLASEEFNRGPSLRVIESDGVLVVVDPEEPDFGAAIARTGTWEPRIGQTIEDILPPGGIFVDIGANVGVMSFRAARKVGAEGRVFAFEPNPLNVDLFLRGVIANGFQNVTLFPVAASDRQGPIFTLASSNGKVLAGAEVLQPGNACQAMVPDHLLAGLDRVDLIKLDIEGFEVQALRGLTETLARHKPKVLCEFNPLCLRPQGGIEPEAMLDLVFSWTSAVTVIHSDEVLGDFHSADAVMGLWRDRDIAVSQAGILPRGWTHFDLLFQVDR